MDKIDALKRILVCIEDAKAMPVFYGRALLLKELFRLYALVNLYKPSFNYNEICAIEAERIVELANKGGGKLC